MDPQGVLSDHKKNEKHSSVSPQCKIPPLEINVFTNNSQTIGSIVPLWLFHSPSAVSMNPSGENCTKMSIFLWRCWSGCCTLKPPSTWISDICWSISIISMCLQREQPLVSHSCYFIIHRSFQTCYKFSCESHELFSDGWWTVFPFLQCELLLWEDLFWVVLYLQLGRVAGALQQSPTVQQHQDQELRLSTLGRRGKQAKTRYISLRKDEVDFPTSVSGHFKDHCCEEHTQLLHSFSISHQTQRDVWVLAYL